jgi:ATP-dependent Clp protease adaptor protein ClpS
VFVSHSDSIVTAGDTAVADARPAVQTPPMYRVLLMNDDFTPMDFVIHVLQKFFSKPAEEATQIMLEVHHKGAGTCGVFTHEIAETKVHIVNTYARQNRFPLKCTMEKAEA